MNYSEPMGRDDWYRNTRWDRDIEAVFRAKLARSRSSRPQYLRIQAGVLASEYPHIALGLIEEYFDTGDEFDVPAALCVRAEAYRALGRDMEALQAYKHALDWERTHLHQISTARIDLPKMVVDKHWSNEYTYALDILTSRFTASDHQFPAMRYVWNGCCALITHELGQRADAKEFADRALRAATQAESPFRYHRKLGVVSGTSDEFGRRLKKLAKTSRVSSLWSLWTNR